MPLVIPALDRQADRAPWSWHNRLTAEIYHFRWCVYCRGRSPPAHTHMHTPHININTHHWSPLERSISWDHTASSGSQALLTRSADVDGSFTQPDSWPSIITGVRGPATPGCWRGEVEGWYWRETRFVLSSFFFFEAKCQTLKHVSTVQARYRISE